MKKIFTSEKISIKKTFKNYKQLIEIVTNKRDFTR